MTLSYFRNFLFLLDLFVVLAHASATDASGTAVTTRFWDCCKPSCGWKAKADFTQPVQTCTKDQKPLTDFDAGTACNGGDGFQCSNQQPWAVNDTLSYGFAGIFITGHVEDYWCCACYQLDFTSEGLENKTMIVQASNTAYDVTTTNRFSLAIPGGNTTSHDACTTQFGVEQSVFGEENSGVSSKDDCNNLPEALQDGCRWRFDWFQNAEYPSANFKRVTCPSELTQITGCARHDDKQVQAASSGNSTNAANRQSPRSSVVGTAAMILAGLLSV
ncbi:endoglucanase 1 precursor [Polyplosphaeria fusca]|uniref:cellulase n=1 Tax=Polyplosphaeria fusca TaxID=682080 RepID=A0A9P4R851_9PLEO|nr:endoglucanase 1 precursor [Polyplosphaeria fusca]